MLSDSNAYEDSVLTAGPSRVDILIRSGAPMLWEHDKGSTCVEVVVVVQYLRVRFHMYLQVRGTKPSLDVTLNTRGESTRFTGTTSLRYCSSPFDQL